MFAIRIIIGLIILIVTVIRFTRKWGFLSSSLINLGFLSLCDRRWLLSVWRIDTFFSGWKWLDTLTSTNRINFFACRVRYTTYSFFSFAAPLAFSLSTFGVHNSSNEMFLCNSVSHLVQFWNSYQITQKIEQPWFLIRFSELLKKWAIWIFGPFSQITHEIEQP